MQILQIGANFDRHLGPLIAQYGTLVYALLFAVVFCEIGLLPLFFLPGDPLLFVCGAFCASGAIQVWIVVPLLFAATLGGSIVNYALGRALGRQVFVRDLRWLDQQALRRTEAFYESHGSLTFLLSPFVAVVRTFAPFVGGVAAMTFGRFVAAVATGAAIWVGSLVTGGYFFGDVPVIRDHMGSIVLLGVVAGVGALAGGALWRAVRERLVRRS